MALKSAFHKTYVLFAVTTVHCFLAILCIFMFMFMIYRLCVINKLSPNFMTFNFEIHLTAASAALWESQSN